MKIKVDENLPARLAAHLRSLGHDVDTVADEGIAGCSDQILWEETQRAGRFLITQDLDFSDSRRFRGVDHAGVLVLRFGSPGRDELLDRVASIFETVRTENWSGCLVVASDQKLRIRRPEQP